MKNIIFAAFVMALVITGCTTSQQADRGYYPAQPVYNQPYAYDPYNVPVYDNRYYTRVYNYNDGRYYIVPINPNYNYTNQYNQQREQYIEQAVSNRRREEYREQFQQNNRRREEYREQSQQNNQRREEYREQPKQNTELKENISSNGTRVFSDGTVILPNGLVKHK